MYLLVDSPLQFEIIKPWSSYIKSTLHFGVDGMSMLLLLLTNILVPLIILSSFNENKKYNNNFYALILLMQFGLVGVFTALDGLLFYCFLGSNSYPNLVHRWTLGDEEKELKLPPSFSYILL